MSPSAFSLTLTIDAQISEARAFSEAEVDKMGEDEDDSDIDYDQEDNTAPDDDMQESCDESDDDNDCEQNIKDFIEIVSCLNERVREKWNDPSFKRAFKSFKRNFKKTIQNENTLTRVMFQFARDNSQNINVGRKRKHGSRISV